MIMYFDWGVLEKHTAKDIADYLFYKRYKHCRNRSTWAKVSDIRKETSTIEDSYLLSPGTLLAHIPTTEYELHMFYMYIHLASMRNTFDFVLKGDSSLPVDIALAEGYAIHTLETNNLITIRDDKIYFKYEE